ncbi:MAG: diguanylate cyclase [Rhodoferax sp.]|nr:diguanylate cyclase [Rhodoferax sp.]
MTARALAWFLCLWCTLCAAGANNGAHTSATRSALPQYTVSAQDSRRIELGSGMGVLVDSAGRLTAEQVAAGDQPWRAITQPSPNFGFTRDAHWFRFELHNLDATPLARHVELPIPFIDDVRLYHYVEGHLRQSYALGDEKPFAERAFQNQNFIMPLMLAPGRNLVTMRLASSGTIEAPLRVWDPVQFQEANDHEKLVQGVVAGVLLVMIVYNLFVFFATRDRSYLYYIGFVASYMLFHFTLTGYTFAYIWPQAVRWNSVAISTCMAGSILFSSLFASHFLRLKEFSRGASVMMRWFSIGGGVLVVLSLVAPYSVTVRLGAALTFPAALAALVLGYWRWWRGAAFARFYCLAWTAALAGLGVLNASKFGLIGTNFWTGNAHQIGVVLLVVLLSFTLADRINHERKLRMGAQARALVHEQQARASQQALIDAKDQANRQLEQRVHDRTRDLNQTLEQLQLANERLQRLSTTDGLTQTRNRAFFDQALLAETRRALRLKTALSLIIFDIDHFKGINDTLGHQAGDACLRALAELIRPRIHREGDVLARYGGEEFVVLLINTPASAAADLAEAFRADIEALQTNFETQQIRFTASFGVASSTAGHFFTSQELLRRADQALYQAKNEGRNCVRVAAPV